MLKIGHRGAPAHVPENTIAGFKQAMRMGADGIELDVHLCKSGELVVIHDDTLDRTTNGTGPVALKTLSELRALNANGGEPLPTLAEVFDALGPNAYYFIEIKHADAAVLAATLMDAYVAKGFPSYRMMLISFQLEGLRAAREAFENLRIGASFDQMPPDAVQKAAALGAKTILPNYRLLKQTQIEKITEAGMEVVTWTINDRIDISRTRQMGVHGIMSDYPERLLPHG
jgi:glycerophosphoryl diester phosphodiesterase